MPPQSATRYVSAGHAALQIRHTGGDVGVHAVAVYDPFPHNVPPHKRQALLPAREYSPAGQALQYPSRSTSAVQRKAM